MAGLALPLPTLFGISGKLEELRTFSRGFLSNLENHDRAKEIYESIGVTFLRDGPGQPKSGVGLWGSVTSKPGEIFEWEVCTKIADGLYLGGIPSQRPDSKYGPPSMDELEAPHVTIFKNSIRSVVSFSDHTDMFWNYESYPRNLQIYEHRIFGLDDSTETSLWPYFDEIADQISRTRDRKQNVFVHCHMGVSRSVTGLAAYFLREGLPQREGLPSEKHPEVDEVLKFIQSKRWCARPNPNFVLQLLMYHAFLETKRHE